MITKPLCIFDLETTGTDPREDRIVSIAVIRWEPGQDPNPPERHYLVNPGIPIPAGATEIHGITDEMVKDMPPFSAYAKGLLDFLAGADLCGYNIRSFDLPLLHEELLRCGHRINLEDRKVFDPLPVFYRDHPRNLAGALKVYLDVEMETDKAHDALYDARCAGHLLMAMMEDRTLEEIHEVGEEDRPIRLSEMDRWFDETDDGLRFRIGKHVGKLLSAVAAGDGQTRSYLDWMVRKVQDADVHGAIAMAQMEARVAARPGPPEQRSLL